MKSVGVIWDEWTLFEYIKSVEIEMQREKKVRLKEIRRFVIKANKRLEMERDNKKWEDINMRNK